MSVQVNLAGGPQFVLVIEVKPPTFYPQGVRLLIDCEEHRKYAQY